MPNGRPGDHPYTDIVVHGDSSRFGAEVSDLIRDMATRPGYAAVREEVVALLEDIDIYPRPNDWDAVLAALLARLRALAARQGER